MEKAKKANLVSQPNIPMPPKKTDYQKALEHFKVEGKSAKEASNKLKYNALEKVGNKYVRIDKDSSAFREKFEKYIIRKWKNDTQQYKATFNIKFNRLSK